MSEVKEKKEEQRFPARREDGSFRVLARYSTSAPEVFELVCAYVDAWVRANRTWTRIWRSSSIEEEHLELATEFSADPRVDRTTEEGLTVVFEGRAASTRWKDWAVRLTQDLSAVFPEVRFERFES